MWIARNLSRKLRSTPIRRKRPSVWTESPLKPRRVKGTIIIGFFRHMSNKFKEEIGMKKIVNLDPSKLTALRQIDERLVSYNI